MCTSPLTIKNPFFGLTKQVLKHPNLPDYKLNLELVGYLHNTHESKILVPCGKCSQCCSLRQSFYNQRVQMESLRSHLFQITLTYNKNVPLTDILDYHLMYPDFKDVQNMFKRMRAHGYKFRYWIVSEYGTGKRGNGKRSTFRPHYHGIIALDKSDYPDVHPSVLEQSFHALFLKYWVRNIAPPVWNEKTQKWNHNRNPKYVPLLDYVVKGRKRTFDFRYIVPVPGHDNDLSFYISKYILKFDTRIDGLIKKIRLDPRFSCDKERIDLINRIRPRSCMSKDFGSFKFPEIESYIKKCISSSQNLPQFVDLYTGKSSLLSPYYRKHLMPLEWFIDRHHRLSILQDSLLIPDDSTSLDYRHRFEKNIRLNNKFSKIKVLLNEKFN